MHQNLINFHNFRQKRFRSNCSSPVSMWAFYLNELFLFINKLFRYQTFLAKQVRIFGFSLECMRRIFEN